MLHDYVDNYLQAINQPLPELQTTFKAELGFLKDKISSDFTIIDVGCGAGRPADILASFCKKIICLDNDSKMLAVAKDRCLGLKNIEFILGDALQLPLADNSFDFVFATYNLVGSLPPEQRLPLIKEMSRVAKPGAKIVNITWKDDVATSEFLKKYYPSIGIAVLDINSTRTITSKGVFSRISQSELKDFYNLAGLKDFELIAIGPVWQAIVAYK